MARWRLAPAFVLTALALTAAVGTPLASAGGRPTAPVNHREGTVLAAFRAGTSSGAEREIRRAVGATEVRVIGAGTHVLRVARGEVPAKAARLRRYSQVAYAEPDYVVRADLTPDDPRYSRLWGLSKIGADRAWDLATGSGSVVVGVVDTGVDYTHPDLAANVWSNDGAVRGCPVGTHGYNAIANTCDPLDDNGHGTHVSGTIGAVGNNGVGVVGVNWNVSIMGLKFLSAGGRGYISDAVAAIDWAVQAKAAGVNVRVLNNSWGGGGYSRALASEIDRAGSRDILFAAAAGNSGSDNDATPFYPCSYGNANEICVAATTKNDELARFSSFGAASVDLAAPGVGILSTIPGGRYASWSGTSMATPHVTGTAALVLSTGYRSVLPLKATILASVDPLASLVGRVTSGGRLNACKATGACAAASPGAATGVSLGTSPLVQAIAHSDGMSHGARARPDR